jgi:putative ABC transport system permease protein
MGCSRTNLTFTDRPNDAQQAPAIGRHYISAGYFDTLGIPLRAGRMLTPADRAGGAPVTVINDTAARRFWPGESPIGKHVRFGTTTGFTDPAHPVEIVGVVGDVKYEGMDLPIGPDFYTSYLQFAYPDTMVVVKTRGPSAPIVPALRAAIASVDSAVPLYEVMTLDERVRRATGRPRFNTVLLAMFAGAALLLAALGVYGLLSYSVSSRMREIGVRLALGATPRRVLRHFVGRSVRLAVVGVTIGLAVALALTRFAQAMVSDLGAVSLRVPVVVSIVVAIVAAAAAFLPARRASVVDPIVVLKQE